MTPTSSAAPATARHSMSGCQNSTTASMLPESKASKYPRRTSELVAGIARKYRPPGALLLAGEGGLLPLGVRKQAVAVPRGLNRRESRMRERAVLGVLRRAGVVAAGGLVDAVEAPRAV